MTAAAAGMIGNILNSSLTQLDHFVCNKNKGERQQEQQGVRNGDKSQGNKNSASNKEGGGGGDSSVTEISSLGGSDSNLDILTGSSSELLQRYPASPCRSITRSPGFRRKKGIGSDGPKFDMCIPMVHDCNNNNNHNNNNNTSPCASPRAKPKSSVKAGAAARVGVRSSSPKRGVKPAVSGLGDFLEFRKPKRQMAVINQEKFGSDFCNDHHPGDRDHGDNSSVVSEGQRSVLSLPMMMMGSSRGSNNHSGSKNSRSSSNASNNSRQKKKGSSSFSSPRSDSSGVKRPSLTDLTRSQSCCAVTSSTTASGGGSNRSMKSTTTAAAAASGSSNTGSNRSIVSSSNRRGTRVVSTEELLSEYEKLLEDFNDSARVDRTGARRPSIDDCYIGTKSGCNLLTNTNTTSSSSPSSSSRRAGKRRPASHLVERRDAISRSLPRNLSNGSAAAQHALLAQKSSISSSSRSNNKVSSGTAAAAAAMSRSANVSISSLPGHLSAPTLRKPRPIMNRGDSARFPGAPPLHKNNKGDLIKKYQQPTPYHHAAPIKTKSNDLLGGYLDILEEFEDSARVSRSEMKGWD
jgi:hypothetical protein